MAYPPASLRCASHRSPLYLRTTITRARPTHLSQTRSIWWWGRYSRSSVNEDGDDERLLRARRMMRHRFAKMARRRAMWDREPTSNLWNWQKSSRYIDEQSQASHKPSSTVSSRPPKQEKEREPEREDPVVSFHKDFDSFRKAVDRAMERDPYGTLFGRRLWSPPSSNNMSWTSFSWFADPKDMKESTVEASSGLGQTDTAPHSPKVTSTADSEKPTVKNPETLSARPAAETKSSRADDYVYDPIAGRKVLKATTAATTGHSQSSNKPYNVPPPPEPKPYTKPTQKQSVTSDSNYTPNGPRKSIFETLFGENNAVDIPVKVYEPKVYGYGAPNPAKETVPASKDKKKPAFENSRKREFQALKASIIGNTIDTTAEFHGKYNDPSETPPAEKPAPKQEASPKADPDAPLFAGTTYEGRAAAILNTSRTSNWLQQEGFSEGKKSDPVDIPVKKYQKIEPALDRVVPKAEAASDPLQPALDRSTKPKRLPSAAQQASNAEEASKSIWYKKLDAAEKAEDIDLLRSSDVRLRMQGKRQAKQDVDRQKQEARSGLEKSFAAKQNEQDSVSKPDVSGRVDNVRKHMNTHPDGIVARTLKSIAEGLQKYRAPATTMHDVSGGVEAAQRLPDGFHKQSDAKVAAAKESPKTTGFASWLAANESDTAPERTLRLQSHTNVNESDQKSHPLSSATVKKGVLRYPVIEKHTTMFEPRYATLLYDMKDIRRQLFNVGLEIRAVKSRMERRPWKELEAERLDEYARQPLVRDLDISRLSRRLDQVNETEVRSTSADLFKKLQATKRGVAAPSQVAEDDISASGFDEPIFSQPRQTATPSASTTSASAQTPQSVPVKRDTDPKGLDEPVASHIKVTQTGPAAEKTTSEPTKPKVEPPVFTPSGSKVWNDEQPPPMAELKAAAPQSFTSPFVMLINNGSNGVRAVPAPNLPHLAGKKSVNPFEVLATLEQSKASQFLAYFPRLQQAGYELVGGDSNKLTFRKLSSAAPTDKKAATVLDEMPAEIDPPGPSAPIAPPTSTRHITDRSIRQRHRVRRQEDVFSGTTTAPSRPIAALKDETTASVPPPKSRQDSEPAQLPKEGFFARVTRAIRRVTLTVVALAAGAYTIGLISEGVGAQAQAQRAITDGGVAGPRKKIVLPVDSSEQLRRGTRPGIYSTENSR